MTADTARIITGKLRPVLTRYQELVFGYLFGSLVRGDHGPLSDVDLAFYVVEPENFPFSKKIELHGEICRALQRDDINLVIMNQTRNLLLLDDIVREGSIILNRDQEQLDRHAVKILHQAIDFKQQRERELGA